MIVLILSLILVAFVPGAVLLRLPLGDRAQRERLESDERVFWAVTLSITWSLAVAFVLAFTGWYTWQRLLAVNAGVSMLMVAIWRTRLRYGAAAPPSAQAIVPVLLAATALWLFHPPAEYIVGGRDPGVYVNAGVQIARGGALVFKDTTAAALPQQARPLFFPQFMDQPYYSPRFMGFFLLDADSGRVVDQFPHLYPVAIAIGYGAAGLTGARAVTVVAGMLGVLALYFLAVRLTTRAAGAVAAGLLLIHVAEVWYARYPNSEVLTQALALAALLATARAHADGDAFFAPVGGVMLGMLPFARIDAVLIGGCAAAGVLLAWLAGGRFRWSFWVPLVTLFSAFLWYLTHVLAPYAVIPRLWLGLHRTALLVGIPLTLVLVAAGRWISGSSRVRTALVIWTPRMLLGVALALAVYAWFFRAPGDKLAAFDAYAFRTFGWYVAPPALLVAGIGLGLLMTRAFWRHPAFFTVLIGISTFVFYRLRIVPEHFWAARRFVPVILPGTMVLIAAVLTPARFTVRFSSLMLRQAVRLILLALVVWTFWSATTPILNHVEYRGVIGKLEQLATRFGGDELLIFESRGASDLHVLALPLAYIYGKPVLVLSTPKPDSLRFAEFLGWARSRYRNVYFLGGGGTGLLSRDVAVQPIGSDRFQVPEYESLRNAYPTQVRRKEFDFGVYKFIDAAPPARGTVLDVGTMDDLNVMRFQAKERDRHGTFRWTGRQSYVSLLGVTPEYRRLVFWMSSGSRPSSAGPADVELFAGATSLGRVTVGREFAPYTFQIPPEIAAAAAANVDATVIRLVSTTWNPRALTGSDDNRDLGVKVDRVELGPVQDR